ncbi:class I SAM-dependent methyltransferase [Arenimonas sp.]|nr:class I SAM-dependent methyltransferase [Candidatus Parcubacteria bacterium]
MKDLNYTLIDTGDKRKLESYSGYIIDRPDPQALWPKTLTKEWDKVDAIFIDDSKVGKRDERGIWKTYKDLPEDFSITFFKDLKCGVKLNPFKHTGIFPEQYDNWKYMDDIISKSKNKNIKVLNLFGYTGCASLVAANAGAEITHVDASKPSIGVGMKNADLSGLKDKPIRWILDDAFAFVKKELRRGNTYQGIIMDPPAFGRGSAGQVWKLEEQFVDFVQETAKLLAPDALFFIVNGYASGYSHIAYKQNLEAIFTKGKVESKELTIEDSTGKLLPCGIVARWKSE